MVTSPTVGRKVWYRPSESDRLGENGMFVNLNQPLDATIVCVFNDRMVNLVVFDSNGNQFRRLSVTLVQPGDEIPVGGRYCEWMPYQVKQHEKKAGEV